MPAQTGHASSGNTADENKHHVHGDEFTELMKRFGNFCKKLFYKGLNNQLEATKGEQHLFSCPVLIVILLVAFFFSVMIPLFIVSLFCGFSYRFSGDDLGKDSINSVMESATGVAEDVKRSVVESINKNENK